VLPADGSIVVADQVTNRDLWWALRGGTGGNFGIVLGVTYKLYELFPIDRCSAGRSPGRWRRATTGPMRLLR
jgi:FAD/FMN-containing dehydrogenase